jgi:hypothetical protein
VLTVSDGTHTANINMVGTYSLANFHFANDGSNGTLVTDPPANQDQRAGPLSDNAESHFGESTPESVGLNAGNLARLILGCAGNNVNADELLSMNSATDTENLALLGQYMASSFVAASSGQTDTLFADPPPPQPQLLTQPHA